MPQPVSQGGLEAFRGLACVQSSPDVPPSRAKPRPSRGSGTGRGMASMRFRMLSRVAHPAVTSARFARLLWNLGSRRIGFGCDLGQDSATCRFQHRGDLLEVYGRSIVGVGHFGSARSRIERPRQAHLVSSIPAHPLQSHDVFAVHRDDQIVVVEVRRPNQATPHGHFATVRDPYGHGAGIGQLADVPVTGARGIDFDFDPGRACLPTKDPFRKRTAADVAKADEEDSSQRLFNRRPGLRRWARFRPSRLRRARFE